MSGPGETHLPPPGPGVNGPVVARALRQLPNLLSAARLPLAAAFPFAGPEGRVALIAAAVISDFLDGHLARRWNAHSTLGRLLDPLADKAFVLVLVVTLLAEGALAARLGGGSGVARPDGVGGRRLGGGAQTMDGLPRDGPDVGRERGNSGPVRAAARAGGVGVGADMVARARSRAEHPGRGRLHPAVHGADFSSNLRAVSPGPTSAVRPDVSGLLYFAGMSDFPPM